MPIYEYRCASCGSDLEVIQKISDSPLTECPKCGKNSLEKVISATQFQLKGTGWYATDFKESGKKKETTTSTTESTAKPTEKTPSSDSKG
jgi:putative FmdB family regulatory protein